MHHTCIRTRAQNCAITETNVTTCYCCQHQMAPMDLDCEHQERLAALASDTVTRIDIATNLIEREQARAKAGPDELGFREPAHR